MVAIRPGYRRFQGTITVRFEGSWIPDDYDDRDIPVSASNSFKVVDPKQVSAYLQAFGFEAQAEAYTQKARGADE